MAVKVRLNRASINVQAKLARQINGDKVKRDKLLRAFKRGGLPETLKGMINAEIENFRQALLDVFSGAVKGTDSQILQVAGVHLLKPWQPLNPDYAARKQTDSFWFESGDLLDYVKAQLSVYAKGAVESVKVTAAPAKKGDKHIPVNMLFSLKRLSEPLQSIIASNLLQGTYSKKVAEVSRSANLEAYKILVNEQLRSFIPVIAQSYSKSLYSKITGVLDG